MVPSKEDIKEELRCTPGDEWEFDCDEVSINAHLEGESHAKVGHFVVRKGDRNQGIGSKVFDALVDVLRDNGVFTVKIEIQAVDDGGRSDDVVRFFSEKYGFDYVETFEHHNWGTCVKMYGGI